MMPGPVGRAVRGGITRKRIQTLVIGLVVLVSVSASVLAVALVVDSSAPFNHAFAAQRGAHVAVTLDSAKATSAQLAATEKLPQVTAAAGPFPEVTITPKMPGFAQEFLGSITLAGRTSPHGPVDDVVLQSGHWPRAPGQVVLDTGQDTPLLQSNLGTKFTISGLPGSPTLTLVGTATSITGSAGGWVLPSEISRLRAAGAPATEEMLYRFRSAATDTAVNADIKAVAAALPTGAVVGTQSYLAAGLAESGNIAPFVPFLVAFGVIGLVMSMLIVANVVSGAVVSGYRRIGVLKSIGFVPGQIVGAYTAQAAIPAVVGCLGGLVLGNVLAVPVLSKTANVYGVGALHVPVWVDIAVPATMFCLVAVAAVLPALRAGRLSAVQAIAIGRAPRTGRGFAAHRLLGRLPLPRPATIGLAAPFARPARMIVTLAAILLGASVVTLSVGLESSLKQVIQALSHSKAEPVQVLMPGGGPIYGGPKSHTKVTPGGGPVLHPHGQVKQPTAAQAERAIQAALASEPGTLHYVARANRSVNVVGLAQQVSVTAFRGNSSWTGYDMITGHWFTGPDQVDVATHFLTVTGKSVGDSVTMLFDGKQFTVRIVGEVFDTQNSGLAMITDWQTLAQADPGLTPDEYDVGLKAGISVNGYVQALTSKLGTDYYVAINARNSDVVALMIGLIGTLTLLLTVVAALGVLNTVLLQSRERVHDLGVFKAVGMTPRQTVGMVLCWVAVTGLLASVVAVPFGIILHGFVLPAMAHSVDLGVPPNFMNVYHGGQIALLGLAGIAIAAAGALLPASWAAATRTGSVLHAE